VPENYFRDTVFIWLFGVITNLSLVNFLECECPPIIALDTRQKIRGKDFTCHDVTDDFMMCFGGYNVNVFRECFQENSKSIVRATEVGYIVKKIKKLYLFLFKIKAR
jgi:hypothetical protein